MTKNEMMYSKMLFDASCIVGVVAWEPVDDATQNKKRLNQKSVINKGRRTS